MTDRDELIQLLLDNRAATSTRETTGHAFATVAADLAIVEAGSPADALELVRLRLRKPN